MKAFILKQSIDRFINRRVIDAVSIDLEKLVPDYDDYMGSLEILHNRLDGLYDDLYELEENHALQWENYIFS